MTDIEVKQRTIMLEKVIASFRNAYPDCKFRIFFDQELRLTQAVVEYKDNTNQTTVHGMSNDSLFNLVFELMTRRRELIKFVNEKTK